MVTGYLETMSTNVPNPNLSFLKERKNVGFNQGGASWGCKSLGVSWVEVL